METAIKTLSFSKRLLTPSASGVRETLLRLAAASLDREMYVDSFLGMYLDSSAQLESRSSFLIFDFYRIYIYENSASPGGPKINSVLRCLRDDYPIDTRHLAGYGQDEFNFFYPLETLQILPLYWDDCPPGTMIAFDLTNGEIRRTEAQVHPKSGQPVIESSGMDCLAHAASLPPLQDRLTGLNLRMGPGPELGDLLSPDLGIIRQEDVIVTQFGVPVVITQTANGHEKRIFCSGRNRRREKAVTTARCEALERHCANMVDPAAHLVYGSYAELREMAIDPETLCFRHPRPDSPERRVVYNRELSMYWCAVSDLLTGKSHLVPAQEVWFSTRSLPRENLCIWTTSSGCAVGECFEEALLFSILELVERDAFLMAWYLRRPCQRIDPGSIQSEEFQLFWQRARHTYTNYSIHLFDITTDIGLPAVLCMAIRQHGNGPTVMLSAACRLHCSEAALGAIKDMAGMPDTSSYDDANGRKLLGHPEEVVSPEDHASFYGMEENFGPLQFLDFEAPPGIAAADVDRDSLISRRDRYNLKPVIGTIAGHLNDLGLKVLVRDLTHEEFRARNLVCLRAIIPGLYPMWFGYYGLRFRMTDRIQALSKKFTGQLLDEESSVNLDIHPFD